MKSFNQEIEHIPHDDKVLSDLSTDEANACNTALDIMNSKGEASSLLTNSLGYGTSDWSYRRQS